LKVQRLGRGNDDSEEEDSDGGVGKAVAKGHEVDLTGNSDDDVGVSQITDATIHAALHGGVDPTWGEEICHSSTRSNDGGSCVWKHANIFKKNRNVAICNVGGCRKTLNIGQSRSTSVISKHLSTAHDMR
jgi:2C-methyl-D-erythritol 2,4-cyclodiphosphate synthase